MGRSPCCDKAKVKKGPWSLEEDSLLKNFLLNFGNGGNWISLPRKAGLNRCGKICRLRWLNYLRPNIKHGDFTDEEDHIIYTLYNTVGSRWSVIASILPGRTDNDVKNYWNTKLRRKILAGKIKNIPLNGFTYTQNNNNNFGISAYNNANKACSTFTSPISNDSIYNRQNLGVGKTGSKSLEQQELVLHDQGNKNEDNMKGGNDLDLSHNNSASSSMSTQETSSQCSGSSFNFTDNADYNIFSSTINGLGDNFWMDLFSETFDEDVVVGSQLVEDKIGEIASLLDDAFAT